MGTDSIPEPTLVTAREHLEEIVAESLGRSRRLALDTESNGFYAYREKVCLLQISTEREDFVVDPIAISDLSCLAPLFADPAVEKLFHAGEYDVLCLKRDYGFSFENLFDTMIAARLLGIKELGLAAAIERHFGLRLSKKLQRADWGLRPLSAEQIRYAQMDTHFLMRLADIQKEQLAKKGRLEDAREAFAHLAALRPVKKAFDPEGYWKLLGNERLPGPQMACLRELYLFREEQAARRDRAHFRVMADELLVRLAKSLPETAEQLQHVKGMTPYLLQRYQAAVLRAVSRGLQAQPPAPPPPKPRARRDPRQWRLFELLRQWRKAQADREGVDPVVILSSDALREIARLASEDPAGDALRGLSHLKRRRYEDGLRAVLAQAD
ncbi:MAG: HRDC domain-containing protein [Elusimicrobia bacterium]|nr:HRDC domain-containing protein [Elusimicrobiota bacterium]MDE2425417.1 HRDC domain-containing protein [Elusimicrobiota bacterium]